ncbi:MAG TPA: YbaB/EbfC family nucleoid-associated protein [Pirellulales bacterium]|nr:YbaB/EbfC family nucleoid-associated protein [Pirellulales bacterium]
MLKGLGNLANIGSLIKQAQQMGAHMEQMGEEMKKRRVEASVGGGMVTIEVNGAGEVLRCRIDPSLLNPADREMLEDLIASGVNQAVAKSVALRAEALQSMSEGSGLGDLLARLSGGGAEGTGS